MQDARELGPEILRRERIGVITLNVLLVFLRGIGPRNDAHFHGRDIITLLGDLRRITCAELNVPWKGNTGQAFQQGRFPRALVTDHDELDDGIKGQHEICFTRKYDGSYLRQRDVLPNILLPKLVNLLQERSAHQMTILTKALDVGHGGDHQERLDQVRNVGYQKTKNLELDSKCLVGCPRWHGDKKLCTLRLAR